MTSPTRLALRIADLGLALGLVPAMEVASRLVGPRPLVSALRLVGRRAPARDAAGRAWLQRVLGAVDRRLPGGERCYRRVLCEIALDAGAAGEPLRLGLDGTGALRGGHAWLGDARGREQPYEVELSL